MWVLLDHAGNSATAQRIALMQRYLRVFGASQVRARLADREFVGAEWIDFLNKNNAPFVIRIKEDMLIRLTDGTRRQFRTLLRKHKRGTWEGWLTGMNTSPGNRLSLPSASEAQSCSSLPPTSTMPAMPWASIANDGGSNVFGRAPEPVARTASHTDAKTRGLNLEDTHITDPTTRATLLVLIALALTWACRSATHVIGRRAIRRNRHGRCEKSWFRTGLDALRKWIIHSPHHALDAWTNRYPRRSLKVSK